VKATYAFSEQRCFPTLTRPMIFEPVSRVALDMSLHPSHTRFRFAHPEWHFCKGNTHATCGHARSYVTCFCTQHCLYQELHTWSQCGSIASPGFDSFVCLGTVVLRSELMYMYNPLMYCWRRCGVLVSMCASRVCCASTAPRVPIAHQSCSCVALQLVLQLPLDVAGDGFLILSPPPPPPAVLQLVSPVCRVALPSTHHYLPHVNAPAAAPIAASQQLSNDAAAEVLQTDSDLPWLLQMWIDLLRGAGAVLFGSGPREVHPEYPAYKFATDTLRSIVRQELDQARRDTAAGARGGSTVGKVGDQMALYVAPYVQIA
jgi:hypothetical protein